MNDNKEREIFDITIHSYFQDKESRLEKRKEEQGRTKKLIKGKRERKKKKRKKGGKYKGVRSQKLSAEQKKGREEKGRKQDIQKYQLLTTQQIGNTVL